MAQVTANFPSSAPAFGQDGFHKTNNLGATTLNGGITSGATSAVVTSATAVTTWPTANFTILNATKNELAFCTSRTGTTLTIVRSSAGGFGGMAAAAWDNGDTIRVVLASEAIQKVFDEVVAIGTWLLAGGAGLNAADNETITGLWDFSNASGLKTAMLTERSAAGGITLNLDVQDYLLVNRSAALAIQSRTAGTNFFLDLFARDGDGTDGIEVSLFAKGTPLDVTNYERLWVRYSSSGLNYEIGAVAGGTGTVRPLHLYTGGNTSQIILETTGNVAFDTNVLYVDSVNNRVGVNKTTPGTALDVTGTVTATAFVGNGAGLTGIASGTGGVTNTGSTTIGADTDADGIGVVVLQTRGLTRLTVENDGNVGIGITPTKRFHVSTADLEVSIFASTHADGGYVSFPNIGIGTMKALSGGGSDTANAGFRNNGGGFIFMASGATEIARIVSTGVGIGTSSPDTILQAISATPLIAINSATNDPSNGALVGGISFGGNAVDYSVNMDAGIRSYATAAHSGSSHPADLRFYTKDATLGPGSIASEVGRFTDVGNFAIGGSTFGTSATKTLGLFIGTEPSTSPADMIQLFTVDVNGAGTASLGLRTEQAVEANTDTASHILRVKLNGTVYGLLLTDSP